MVQPCPAPTVFRRVPQQPWLRSWAKRPTTIAHHVHKIQGCAVKNESFQSLGRGRPVLPNTKSETKGYRETLA